MRKLYLIPLLAALVAIPSPGQTHPARRNDKIQSPLFLHGDTASAEQALKGNRPQSFNIPGLPRFAIFGSKGNFYLGIGGQIKGTVGYDLGNVIDNPNDFTTSAIPIPALPGERGKFQISGQQTSFVVNFVALPGKADQIGAYISVDFTGNDYTPSLSQAYLKYRGITAGYANSLFSDAAAVSPTIDDEGPNAYTGVTHALVYWEQTFGKRKDWKFGVGIEQPTQSYTLGDKTEMITQKVPDIPVYLQYSWAKGNGWLRLSGMVRNLYYRDLSSDRNVDKVGWGVKLSGSTPVVGPLTAYYQAVYGEGIASYIQDCTGLGLDMTPSAGNSSVLNPVKAWGAYAGLQYTFSPKVFATASYSHVRTYADSFKGGSTPFGEQYKYAQYVVANLFWTPNPLLQTGIEYLYGRRVDYSGAQGHDNRIQAMIALNF